MRYAIINNEYMNTGGGCMVGVSEVWLPDEKRMVYVNANEDGASVNVVDFISNDLDDTYDESWTITDLNIDAPDVHDKYFKLMRECVWIYIKADCKRYGHTYRLPECMFPTEMIVTVSEAYLEFISIMEEKIETDGNIILMHPDYNEYIGQLHDFNSGLQAAMETALDGTAEQTASFYDTPFEITFGDNKVTINNDADSYSAILSLVQQLYNEQLL